MKSNKIPIKIAIISPGYLPVPAVQGGAVEILSTYLHNGFSNDDNYELATYTIQNVKIDKEDKNVVQVCPRIIDKIIIKIIRVIFRIIRFDWQITPFCYCAIKAIRKKEYSYIIVENNMNIFYWLFKFGHKNTKIIFHMHNDLDGISKTEKKCKYIGENAYCVVCVSNFINDVVKKCCKDAETVTLYNAIEMDQFDYHFNNFNANILRVKYNIDSNKKILLYSGRLAPEKGVLELLKAFNLVLNDYPNICLVIIGTYDNNSTYERKYYEELLENSNENVFFAGRYEHSDMPKVYAESDIVVIPTLVEEAFGLVAIEAMAARKCIIASNCKGLLEILGNDCALIVKRDNIVNELYFKISHLLDNPQICEEISSNAFERVRSIKEFNCKNYYTGFIKKVLL